MAATSTSGWHSPPPIPTPSLSIGSSRISLFENVQSGCGTANCVLRVREATFDEAQESIILVNVARRIRVIHGCPCSLPS